MSSLHTYQIVCLCLVFEGGKIANSFESGNEDTGDDVFGNDVVGGSALHVRHQIEKVAVVVRLVNEIRVIGPVFDIV